MFGGFIMPALGVLGMVAFSLSLFFNLSLSMLWLFLELSGLCLIPLFFTGAFFESSSGLFYYIVFSGISSCLLLLGILLPDCVYFLIAGFLMKFGVFPLWGWVYRVCCFSGWPVIWGFSTVLKVSLILLPLFLVVAPALSFGVSLLCGLGLLLLSLLFWLFCNNWKVCWCHMMLSGSMTLLSLSLSGGCINSLVFIYFVYFLWSSAAIFYLYLLGEGRLMLVGGWSVFFFSFLFLSLPFSLSIFYKILLSSSVFCCGFFLIASWVVYSLSEQLYLFLYLTGLQSGKEYVGVFELV